MNTRIQTTRAALAATAAHNVRWFASILAGTSVLGASAAFAADWTGDTDADWNNPLNWTGDAGPGGAGNNQNAVVNDITLNTPTISADTPGVVDINIGSGAGAIGQVNHVAGTSSTGSGNWARTGTDGGTGVYNLGIPGGAGLLSGLTLGSGSFIIPGTAQYHVGEGAGSSGTVNINTSGSLTVSQDLVLGRSGGTGTLNLDAGTVTTQGWNFFGDGVGSQAFLNIGGGTFQNNSIFQFGVGGGTATIVQTGGALNNSGEIFLGTGTGSEGTVPGTATYTLSGGSVTVGDWITIGRSGGSGTLTMTGGSLTKTTGGGVSIAGNNGTNSSGTVTISAGLIDVQSNFLWVGQNGTGATGTLTLSGTGEIRTPELRVGWEGAVTGTANLNGGTLKTLRIDGNTGTSNVNFNGTQIVATGEALGFIGDLTTATIGAGNLKVDSAGFTLTAPQALSGTGGVVKSGAGSLILTGPSSYSGDNVVNAGKLSIPSDSLGGGDVIVADNAGFGVVQVFVGSSVLVPNATFGSSGSSTLDFDFGDFFDKPAFALLEVTGTLTLNGTVTINIADMKPQTGTFPLLTYNGAIAGGGNFVLGTVPDGVVAHLDTTSVPGEVSLVVDSVAQPVWDATVNNLWDTTTANWFTLVGNTPTTYANGNPALFNDDADGSDPGTVTLNQTVTPTGVTFDNSDFDYTLGGTGKISGTGGMLKTGVAKLTVSTLNDYSGPTRIEEGTLETAALANLGVASGIGGASPLVFAGGTLNYTGATTTLDRGYTVSALDDTVISTISTVNGLTLGGAVDTVFGSFAKAGPGTLTHANPGANVLAKGGYSVNAGALVLVGGGTQTNSVGNVFNLSAGTTADLVSSSLTVGGETNIGNLAGANATLTLGGASTYNANSNVYVGIGGAGSSGEIMISGTSQFNHNNGWLVIGAGDSNGTLTVKDNGVLNQGTREHNIGDGVNSTGTLVLQDNGTINAGRVFWGKNAGAEGIVNISGGTFNGGQFWVGDNSTASGTVTQTGGVVNVGGTSETFIGANGTAVWNQSGGTVNAGGWTVVARYVGSNGTLNVSGGTFTQTQLDRRLHVGEEGTGVLNVSGTGAVVIMGNGGLLLGGGAAGNGTANLNGGSITTKQVKEDAQTSAFNFNGGTLVAATGANADFMSGIDNATVLAGGAKIDSNGQNIGISQVIGGSGGFTKLGAGTLTLAGANTYTGNTTVEAGTLSLTAPNLANGSTLTIGTVAASPAVLNLPNAGTDIVAALVIDGSPVAAGTYGALGSGAQFTTDAITGSGFIQVGGSASAYDSWASSFGLNPATDGAPGFDKDKSGQTNAVEFSLGGSPVSGSNNAKIYSLAADGDDGGTQRELLMTIAVRDGGDGPGGAPVFSVATAPSASIDGVTITVRGSLNLAAFATGVTQVAPVTTGMPPAPAGYEYRTFSLDGSNGLTARGFLAVDVSEEAAE